MEKAVVCSYARVLVLECGVMRGKRGLLQAREKEKEKEEEKREARSGVGLSKKYEGRTSRIIQ